MTKELSKWNLPVDVVCYNNLTTFKTRKQAKNFFYHCSLCSEGSERERYVNIFLQLESTNNKMVDDEYNKNPTIFSRSEYNGNYLTNKEYFDNHITYKKYLELQKEKQELEL